MGCYGIPVHTYHVYSVYTIYRGVHVSIVMYVVYIPVYSVYTIIIQRGTCQYCHVYGVYIYTGMYIM